MKRSGATTIAILILFVLGAVLALITPIAENQAIQSAVTNTLRHDYGLKDCTLVKVSSNPFSLLRGNVKQIYVECAKGNFDGVKTRSIAIFMRDVKLDLPRSLAKRRIIIGKVGRASARIVFGENELNQYIANNYPDLSQWKVSLRDNSMVANAAIDMIGQVEVAFKPRVDGKRIILVPVGARFLGRERLGIFEAKNWVRAITIGVPVDRLQFGMRVTRILVQDGELAIAAEN